MEEDSCAAAGDSAIPSGVFGTARAAGGGFRPVHPAEVPAVANVDMHAALKDSSLLSQLQLNYPVSIVVAMTKDRGIGHNNQLPWPHIPTDLRFFSHLTRFKGNQRHQQQHSEPTPAPAPASASDPAPTAAAETVVIMGRNTWESLPATTKPLKGRINVIISSKPKSDLLGSAAAQTAEVSKQLLVCNSLPAALLLLEQTFGDRLYHVFIIGGSMLYASALCLGVVSNLFITRIANPYPCSVFFPSFGSVSSSSSDSSGGSSSSSGSGSGSNTSGSNSSSGTSSSSSSGLMRGDSGCWAEETDGFEMQYISKSLSAAGVSFDFVVLERKDLLQQQQQKQQQQQLAIQQQESFDPCLAVDLFFLKETSAASVAAAVSKLKCCGHEERQYLQLIEEILNHGVCQPDRTGTGVISQLGRMMRFSLEDTFPLLTTKRVFWKGVVEELLWFIRGDTNANNLSKLGVKIWNQNASREFLDSCGLTDREVGDIGPVYGFQWRHFGAEYTNMHADYTGKGVDQLKDVIHKLRTNPHDRRIIMTAWNPAALSKMALPPCHMMCQFFVCDGSLSCLMYQRSCDVGLGVPFNIASYALLTVMLAAITNLKPREFIHVLGHTHVYRNHVEALKEQIQRLPRPFPTLRVKGDPKEIEDFTAESFELTGYVPHPVIKMDMAV